MVVIDTHILIWFVNGSDQLSKIAQDTINQTLASDDEIIISSISTWEISMLINKNRLVLSMDIESWLNNIENIQGFRFAPVDNEIAFKSTELPGEFHKDPADRMIVATARKLAVPLITADQKIRQYKHITTIW
ncbi:MAG: type II toxin-antitoxin system VapC family toxin [Gammaproteobacteria bacterium]|nr:type II toxin-antitoxin system VapC family toxin [Gammaproteobacteria bacterium]